MPTVATPQLKLLVSCHYLKSEDLDLFTISFDIFQGLIYRLIRILLILRPNFRRFFSEIKPDDVPKTEISLDFTSVKHAR